MHTRPTHTATCRTGVYYSNTRQTYPDPTLRIYCTQHALLAPCRNLCPRPACTAPVASSPPSAHATTRVPERCALAAPLLRCLPPVAAASRACGRGSCGLAAPAVPGMRSASRRCCDVSRCALTNSSTGVVSRAGCSTPALSDARRARRPAAAPSSTGAAAAPSPPTRRTTVAPAPTEGAGPTRKPLELASTVASSAGLRAAGPAVLRADGSALALSAAVAAQTSMRQHGQVRCTVSSHLREPGRCADAFQPLASAPGRDSRGSREQGCRGLDAQSPVDALGMELVAAREPPHVLIQLEGREADVALGVAVNLLDPLLCQARDHSLGCRVRSRACLQSETRVAMSCTIRRRGLTRCRMRRARRSEVHGDDTHLLLMRLVDCLEELEKSLHEKQHSRAPDVEGRGVREGVLHACAPSEVTTVCPGGLLPATAQSQTTCRGWDAEALHLQIY